MCISLREDLQEDCLKSYLLYFYKINPNQSLKIIVRIQIPHWNHKWGLWSSPHEYFYASLKEKKKEFKLRGTQSKAYYILQMDIRRVAYISRIYGVLCINEGLLKLQWNSTSFVEFKENL